MGLGLWVSRRELGAEAAEELRGNRQRRLPLPEHQRDLEQGLNLGRCLGVTGGESGDVGIALSEGFETLFQDTAQSQLIHRPPPVPPNSGVDGYDHAVQLTIIPYL